MPDSDDKQKEVQIMKTLIESQWANEVSAQARANINAQKWNKNELIPLTTGLKKLKQGLERLTQESYINTFAAENAHVRSRSPPLCAGDALVRPM